MDLFLIYYIHGSSMMKWIGDEHIKVRSPLDKSFPYRLESVFGSVYLQFHIYNLYNPGGIAWINLCSM